MALRSGDATGEQVRLVAMDLTGAHRHVEVASWQMPSRMPATWGSGFSSSQDGRRVAIAAAGARGASALYLLETASGAVRTLFDDATEHAMQPVLSADGSRLAFLRLPVTQGGSGLVENGIYAGRTEDPSTWRRIVTQEPPSTTVPLAWSPDGAWLAFARLFIGGTISLVRNSGDETVVVGRGTSVDWRVAEPKLLVSGPSNGGGGTGVWTFDVTARILRQVATPASPELGLWNARWHPQRDRFLYTQTATASPGSPVLVWTRNTDGRDPVKIADAAFLFDVRWSHDGTRVYGTYAGDDSVFRIADLITGETVTRGCWRGDVGAPVCA